MCLFKPFNKDGMGGCLNNARNEKDYTTKMEVENNPQWGKKCKTFPCN
jgi:hypothetical protein